MDNGQWMMENYYDLQGQKVTQPKRGIYIQQQGGKTDKRVMK
jgi:hypothetical protein